MRRNTSHDRTACLFKLNCISFRTWRRHYCHESAVITEAQRRWPVLSTRDQSTAADIHCRSREIEGKASEEKNKDTKENDKTENDDGWECMCGGRNERMNE